jgi:hypothetical protein
MADKLFESIIRELDIVKANTKPFSIKPKHWWTYLNPFWWKKKRIIERLLEYQWKNGGEAEAEKRIKNALLYGTSHPEMWKDESE